MENLRFDIPSSGVSFEVIAGWIGSFLKNGQILRNKILISYIFILTESKPYYCLIYHSMVRKGLRCWVTSSNQSRSIRILAFLVIYHFI